MHFEEVCLGQGCWWGGIWEVGFATSHVNRHLQFPGLSVTLLSMALKCIRNVKECCSLEQPPFLKQDKEKDVEVRDQVWTGD